MMQTKDFDYNLNKKLIAYHPPKVRGTSRLLVLNKQSGSITDDYYKNIVDYLNSRDVLVLNDTKVIPARIRVTTSQNKLINILLLEEHGTNLKWFKHQIMYPGKLKLGEILTSLGGQKIKVTKILGDGLALVESENNLLTLSEKEGKVPLPPYIKRETTLEDSERYQTMWAKKIGSVAAPTASLNMTPEILAKIEAKGIKVTKLTLHVGIGTFMPIRVDELKNHKMHQEYFEIPLSTIKAIQSAKNKGNKIVALGTTVARSLEYASDKILFEHSKIQGEADIFIYPGYKFKVVDTLITNFHAPKSTVLMLTAAFSNWEKLKKAYDHAQSNNYQLLSFGDSMLIY
jgi:S-adenosylmethionine:tRNA ribosyltransferase-isomerase